MLNSTTKNRINSCRDILVGKIPDPKGQIDQITNALVYKFMDDQDRMSRELGYEASFFRGDYVPYAWTRLFDTKLTNQDKANLYIEWLDRLSQAEHLPELFRQIFKDAYLPFRDANTIVMFLTEINWFDYHHSEELGNAFEYLLSIMGSQGDAGQFRTPRHIIEFLVDVVDPDKSETILDPACGTAGFLVEAFKHITAKWDLGVQDVAKLAESITGVDIDPGMAKIARVNLYLHGFKTPKITENDTLTNEKLWGQKYDVILANPPFMTPKWGIQPHDKFSIRANRAEVLFTDYIAEHLKLAGRAGIIVPEGIIFQWSNAYKDLRKMLVDGGYLWAVVSLPAGVFNPYSGVKTSILFLDRERAKKTDKILFVKIKEDGYDLGAQRRVIAKNDLPEALEILNAYKENPNIIESHPELVWGSLAHLVEKSRIAESGDYNLSGDRYIVDKNKGISKWEILTLREIAKVWNGKAYKQEELLTSGKYPVIRVGNFFSNRDWYYSDLELEDNKYCEDWDLLYAWSASFGPRIWDGIKSIYHYHIWKIEPNKDLNKKYLFYFLEYVTERLKSEWGRWIAMMHLTKENFENQKIPLPPLEIQEQIVAELDGYQRIIDGARAVVENYKPMIKIDPEWEMVELGEVCDVISWWTPSKTIENYWNSNDISWLRSEVCKDKYVYETKDFISKEWFQNSSAKLLKPKSTLIALVWATIWKTAFLTFESTTNQNIAWLFPKNTTILLPEFVFFASQTLYNQFINLGNWDFKMANLSFVRSLKIPLPSLDIQQSIVDRIMEEQRLIDGNLRLIEIYEGKIRERMDEVWGVEK